MTVLAAAFLLGACHCAKCTTAPNRSNTCEKPACHCKHHRKHHKGCPCMKKELPPETKPAPAPEEKPAPKPAPKAVEEKDFTEVATVAKTADDKMVLSFKEPINFKYNSEEINPESMEQLHKTAAALKKYPDAKVRVAGYTDSLGNPDYNVDLSQRRAKAVALSLVKDGVPADKVSFIGYGAARPVATNKTAAGRAQNRRVELEVMNQ